MKSSHQHSPHFYEPSACKAGRTATPTFFADAAHRSFVQAFSLESVLVDSILPVLLCAVIIITA